MKPNDIYKISGNYNNNKVHLTAKIIEDKTMYTKIEANNFYGKTFRFTFIKPYKKLKWYKIWGQNDNTKL